jgi:uncharacterized protein YqhQ
MGEEKPILGGMALANGVLVVGPTAWGCAVRTDDGQLKAAAGGKPLRTSRVGKPFLRGPLRLLEALLVLPEVRRALPEARFPFQRRSVLGAIAVTAVVTRLVRSSRRLSPVGQELAVGLLSLAPAAFMLRGGDVAGYHGAEHVSIGSYEHGTPRPREHERCGSHLAGPLIVSSALAAGVAARAPERMQYPAKVVSSVVALAAATEVFSWMVRHQDTGLAKVLAWPGHQLQHRLATADPTREQLEVAEVALAACLERERSA